MFVTQWQQSLRRLFCLRNKIPDTTAALALSVVLLGPTESVRAQSAQSGTREGRAEREALKAAPDKDKDLAAMLEEARQMRQAIEHLETRVNQLEAEKRAAQSTSAAASPSQRVMTEATANRAQPPVVTESR